MRKIDADALILALKRKAPISDSMRIMLAECLEEVNNSPTVESEYQLDEWCTDCKEYDHNKHCCPRFNRVIATTLNESVGK